MIGSKGMPVSVQVVGLPGQDEKVMRVMQEIEEGAQYKSLFGVTLDPRIKDTMIQL